MELITELSKAEDAVKTAALVGNIPELRRAQRKRNELKARFRIDTQQQVANVQPQRTITPPPEAPAAGEEKRLASDERELRSTLARLQSERGKHLSRLASMPEDESVISAVEDCDRKIASASLRLEGIHIRQNQIGECHAQQERIEKQKAEAKERKSRDAERLRLEKSAASVAAIIVELWQELLLTLKKLDETEAKLKQMSGLKNSCPPVDAARLQIKEKTNGAISFLEPDARTPRETRIAYSEGGRAFIPPITNSRYGVI
ncbi:MAG: hypothetical protein ACYCOX_02190 [Acidobacteriaceae bacterium]